MPQRYGIADYWHFFKMHRRNSRRQKVWARRYEACVRRGDMTMPAAAVVQLIPTEACNLRCAMCNQWGENGYILNGLRKVEHMDPDGLTGLMRSLSPAETMISVHGGEPFAYKHMPTLLELLREQQFDVIFSTNGTLFDGHYEGLAELKNLALLLSVDGDEATHDAIRGAGRFRQTRDGLRTLFEVRRRRGMPPPLVIMSLVVCEFNTDVIERAFDVACELGAFVINYNLRWFLTEEVGLAYEKHLEEHFGLQSSGAWRGWIAQDNDADYSGAARMLQAVLDRRRRRLQPPYVMTMPKGLKHRQFVEYYTDYGKVFGNDSCFMPFYWARVHSNGDLIYCPGHPDIIAGNVFRDGLLGALNSERSKEFRRHILHNRLPICNRCCGLYMTYAARPLEQRARRRLGLQREVAVSLPEGY